MKGVENLFPNRNLHFTRIAGHVIQNIVFETRHQIAMAFPIDSGAICYVVHTTREHTLTHDISIADQTCYVWNLHTLNFDISSLLHTQVLFLHLLLRQIGDSFGVIFVCVGRNIGKKQRNRKETEISVMCSVIIKSDSAKGKKNVCMCLWVMCVCSYAFICACA